jgi:enoyl-CoA hydratase
LAPTSLRVSGVHVNTADTTARVRSALANRTRSSGDSDARLLSMSLVLTDVSEGIGTLTLNAPDTRNTMTLPMVDEICAAVDAFEADETCSAIIVTGAGSAFCAGADLGNLQTATAESLGKIYEGFLRISRSSLPTIAAVNGAAVGAGMNLALGCDVRIAAQRAKFDTRFLQIGLHPGGGHTWMQRRNVGVQTAMATVVFSEVLDGPEAERLGLAHRCVADELLISAARALAAGAASAPRELVMITKRTIAEMADVDTHDAAVAKELDPQVWTARQPWFEERIAALKAKISSKS